MVAPAFLAASLYSSYGHLIRYVSPEHSPIKRVTLIFVFSDLGLIVQRQSTGYLNGKWCARDNISSIAPEHCD